MMELLIDRIRRQAVRLELCTGRKATTVSVNPEDWGDRERVVDGMRVVLDLGVPRENAWVNS